MEFLPCLDGGGLPTLKVTTGIIHAMSTRTNEYTVPELDTQAKKIINKTDASSVIIELIVEALSYILAGELLSHSANQLNKPCRACHGGGWISFDLPTSQGTTWNPKNDSFTADV